MGTDYMGRGGYAKVLFFVAPNGGGISCLFAVGGGVLLPFASGGTLNTAITFVRNLVNNDRNA